MCPQYLAEFPGLNESTGTESHNNNNQTNHDRRGWEEPTELGRQPEKGWEDRPMDTTTGLPETQAPTTQDTHPTDPPTPTPPNPS